MIKMTEEMGELLNEVMVLRFGEPMEEDIPEMYAMISHVLRQSDCVVNFIKVDGTEREMQCTLRRDALPSVVVKEDTKPKKENKQNIAVWDLEKDQWRSFNVKSVRKVTVKR
jgi:WYL_2, Sm-like SH3 beta-barrel fold